MRRCETTFIQAGHCRHPEAITMIGGRFRSTIFPALSGVFLHPDEGTILFDTGYDLAFLEATRSFPERLYRWLTPPTISSELSARAQLAQLGLGAADVRWIILSHFHGDHIAGLHSFPRAKVMCAKLGLEAAHRGSDWSAVRSGFLRGLIPSDINERSVFFEDQPRISLASAFWPFEHGADIFGDGSLVAVELPGHCPGHWGLACKGLDDRLHFLAADGAWSSTAIRENRPPPRLTTAFLGSTGAYRQTLGQLHRLSVNSPEVLITPSHCYERSKQIRSPRKHCADAGLSARD